MTSEISKNEEDFYKELNLAVGGIAVVTTPHLITTVLGSCVSVCLWDERTHAGAMNHYIMPAGDGTEMPHPRYGDFALLTITERMLSLGCRVHDMVAGIYGGAEIDSDLSSLSAGRRNVEVAFTFLQQAGISILDAKVGGSLGRWICFDTRTGHVKVRDLDPRSDEMRNFELI